MANTLATPLWVTKETARGYTNEAVMVNNVNREYDDQYMIAGAKVGNTVLARMPNRFVAVDGQALQPQNLVDATVPITLTNQKHVDTSYSSAQATTELQMIRQRYTQPAAEALANASDALLFQAVYRDVYSSVGTLGTTPSAALTFLQAGVKLTDLSVTSSGRRAVLDSLAMATMANGVSALFNPGATISENYTNGEFSRRQLGIDRWFVDPNRPVHVSGTFTACTPTVTGAGQTGSSILSGAWANGATFLKKGDILTFAGVNGVNPLSYVSTGRLQQFVLTADVADAAQVITLPISPPIITSGALQTVDVSPANGAAITVWSANPAGGSLATTNSPQSLVFHPDAFAFVMADLVEPNGGAKSTHVRSKALGFSIRYVEQYAISTDQNANRLDILVGAATLQARLAVRVVG